MRNEVIIAWNEAVVFEVGVVSGICLEVLSKATESLSL
jgi:hypothetical protein